MTNTSTRSRQSAGQPTGGQFATEAKSADTGVTLDGGTGWPKSKATKKTIKAILPTRQGAEPTLVVQTDRGRYWSSTDRVAVLPVESLGAYADDLDPNADGEMCKMEGAHLVPSGQAGDARKVFNNLLNASTDPAVRPLPPLSDCTRVPSALNPKVTMVRLGDTYVDARHFAVAVGQNPDALDPDSINAQYEFSQKPHTGARTTPIFITHRATGTVGVIMPRQDTPPTEGDHR